MAVAVRRPVTQTSGELESIRAAPHRRDRAVLARAFAPAGPRCWWRPPIKSRKTSRSVRSCGWRRSRFTCSRSCWPLRATDSTGGRRSPSRPDFSLRLRARFPACPSGSRCGWQLVVYLIALFVTCMICQGELARSRPSPRYLTAFYLTIAAGGALGGVFVALIAPRLFTEFSEYPIGLAAACLLGFVGWLRTRRAGAMDQPQFRRAPAPDGAVDRRNDRLRRQLHHRQARRCGERAEFLRHPARDGARRMTTGLFASCSMAARGTGSNICKPRGETGPPPTMGRIAASRWR